MTPAHTGSSTLGKASLCLIFVAGVLGSLLINETPTGRVTGVIYSKNTGKPLRNAHVVLDNSDPDAETHIRRANTDSRGAFTIPGVEVGTYAVSASSRSHQGEHQDITVTEGAATETTMWMERSAPDLEVAPIKKTFGTKEDISVPLRGYLDDTGDKVTLSVYRARLSEFTRVPQLSTALHKAADRTQPGAGLGPLLLSHSRLVSTQKITIDDADREGFFDHETHLAIKEPGLYLINATNVKSQDACSWITVTNLALVVKQAPGKAPNTPEWQAAVAVEPARLFSLAESQPNTPRHCAVYVSSIDSGAPRAGVKVGIWEGVTWLCDARTNQQGIARFRLPDTPTESGLSVVATDGADEAISGGSGNGNEDAGVYRVAAYTDRPVYRPGDTIYFKGVARRLADGTASVDGSGYTVASGINANVEFRDPQGNRLTTKAVVTNRYGSFWGATTLSSEAPTGYYSLVSILGGEEHTQDVQVAAYRKPEMTVSVKPAKNRYVTGDEVEMAVEGRYFFGAPVAGAKVHYEVYRETDWSALYPDDSSGEADAPEGDDSDSTYGEYVRDGDVRLDAEGRATVHFSTAPSADSAGEDGAQSNAPPPQAQIWSLHVTLEDESQRTVEGSGSTNVAAGDFHMTLTPDGYLANLGQPKAVTLAVKDFEDKPVSGKQVTVRWSFDVWDAKQEKTIQLADGATNAVTVAGGTALLQIPVTRGGSLHVMATARDGAGREISAESSLWAVGGQTKQNEDQANIDGLALFTDHQRYTAGQTAQIVIRSFRSQGATALLSVEGDKIYHAWTVPLTGQSTPAQITLPEDYGPNVTLTACYFQAGKFAQTEIPLRVKVPRRDLRVEVKADGPRHLPGDKVTYNVRTLGQDGKPVSCEFSLGVVDESIYAIAKDNPRLFREVFYPDQSNRVQTSQSLEVQYLGDTNNAAPNVRARRRFEDTAFWLPAAETGPDGTATISCTLPDNLTQWRATAWAQTADSHFGQGIGATIATKPFFVRLNRPRFTVTGDSTQIQGLVHNDTGAPQTANVQLQAPGLSTAAQLTQQVTLAPGADVSVSWPVTVKPGEDASTLIKLTAWTQDRKWADAVEEPLPVRPFGRDKQDAYSGPLEAGTSIRFTHEAGAKTARTTLRLTPSPIDAFRGGFNYLIGFPYGCTEQTTSRMMPDLLMLRLAKVTGRSDLVDARTRRDLPRMVNDSIVRLANLQHGSGAWGWWNYDEDDPYLTAYALTGLALAKQNGFNVPDAMLKNGADAALKIASEKPIPSTPYSVTEWLNNRPALLRAAALAGQPAAALTKRGIINLQNLSTSGLATLALFDRETGGTDAAYRALLAKSLTQGFETSWPNHSPAWNADSDTVGDTALALRAVLTWDKSNPKAAGAMRFLMNQRTGDFWTSTRDTALTLQALVEYVETLPSSGARYTGVRISLNGEFMRQVPFDKEAEVSVEIPAQSLRDGTNTLQFTPEGNGGGGFYALWVRRTLPQTPLGPLEAPGLKVSRQYFRILKRSTSSWKPAVEPVTDVLNQGEDVRVRLTVTNTTQLRYFLLEDAFAPGCEPTQRSNEDMTSAEDWDYWWNSTEIRDDRIAFFCQTLPAGKHVIEYSLRAQTPGKYHVLPAVASPMYAPALRAETGASDLEIR